MAPDLLPYEVMNALDVAWRRTKVLREADAREAARAFCDLRIHLQPSSELVPLILDLCHRLNLSAYDAAYLELALRRGLPLATLEGKLKVAAAAVGVALYSVP
jgi:predicted nucleic acid-binding protein